MAEGGSGARSLESVIGLMCGVAHTSRNVKGTCRRFGESVAGREKNRLCGLRCTGAASQGSVSTQEWLDGPMPLVLFGEADPPFQRRPYVWNFDGLCGETTRSKEIQ